MYTYIREKQHLARTPSCPEPFSSPPNPLRPCWTFWVGLGQARIPSPLPVPVLREAELPGNPGVERRRAIVLTHLPYMSYSPTVHLKVEVFSTLTCLFPWLPLKLSRKGVFRCLFKSPPELEPPGQGSDPQGWWQAGVGPGGAGGGVLFHQRDREKEKRKEYDKERKSDFQRRKKERVEGGDLQLKAQEAPIYPGRIEEAYPNP